MGIADEIQRLTNAKQNIASAITEKGGVVPSDATFDVFGDLVRGLTSGGIIEVSELPTEGINEEAIYKVVTQYEYSPLTMWQVTTDGIVDMQTILPDGASMTGYIVTELPSDMVLSDMNTFQLHVYCLEETGVAYLNISGMGVATMGTVLTGESGFDKGWIDDIYSIDYSDPLNTGVYTTRLVYKDFIRWYIRTDGNWEEISAHVITNNRPTPLLGVYETNDVIEVIKPIYTVDVTKHIMDNKVIPTVTVNVPSVGRFLSRSLTSISKEYLYDPMIKGYINIIPAYGFAGQGMTEIEFPEGLWSIQSYAFYDCPNLALTELPETVTYIGYSAFVRCGNLALRELPSGITEIPYETFTECRSLALTKLPSGLITIDSRAFFNCTSLALTEIPETVTSIDDNAFSGCTGLTTLTFKGTPSSIFYNAFYECTNLTTINVPWAEGAVEGAPWGATNATINYNYTG